MRNPLNGHAGTIEVNITVAGMPADFKVILTQVASTNGFATWQVLSEVRA